jgi:hypothetical protein
MSALGWIVVVPVGLLGALLVGAAIGFVQHLRWHYQTRDLDGPDRHGGSPRE